MFTDMQFPKGRPLRVRGLQVHPELREGSDWAEGPEPDAEGLDAPTRRALEALWLHDAQTEQASVPAFARLTWLLAAVGAPAELLAWAQRAALEEVEHAQRCFALAAGYGGRSHSVEAMPELLLPDSLGASGDPLILLATESLKDGCLLEDFNADVAGACAQVCAEPVTREVLERIAREERSHADFSWALLDWCHARGGPRVTRALRAAGETLSKVPRPTAANRTNQALQALIDAADAPALRAHGRLPDAAWAGLWSARLEATLERLDERLAHPGEALAA